MSWERSILDRSTRRVHKWQIKPHAKAFRVSPPRYVLCLEFPKHRYLFITPRAACSRKSPREIHAFVSDDLGETTSASCCTQASVSAKNPHRLGLCIHFSRTDASDYPFLARIPLVTQYRVYSVSGINSACANTHLVQPRTNKKLSQETGTHYPVHSVHSELPVILLIPRRRSYYALEKYILKGVSCFRRPKIFFFFIA